MTNPKDELLPTEHTPWRPVVDGAVPLAVQFLEFLLSDGTICKGTQEANGWWRVPKDADQYRYAYVNYPATNARPATADAIISDYVQSQTTKRTDKTPLPLAILKQIIIKYLTAHSLAKPQGGERWQDISTAPQCVKGGARDNGRRPVIVTHHPSSGGYHPMAIARKTKRDGWITGNGVKLWFSPTHWRPLPEAPEGEIGE